MYNPELGGGFKYVLFSPRKLGKISNLTIIFQMGWNHQLVKDGLINGWLGFFRPGMGGVMGPYL